MERNRYTRLSREEVDAMQARYERAQRLQDALDATMRRALDRIDVEGFSEETARTLEAVFDAREMAPVPAYLKPVKRWAGGPDDNWYWDRNSF